jgi:hypothetical protein
MKKRKPLPIKRPARVRKGNLPSNPYTDGIRDREGLPLSPPLPHIPTEKGEPIFVMRASSPFSGMVLRFMVNASAALGIDNKDRDQMVRIAAAMDAWRSKIAG